MKTQRRYDLPLHKKAGSGFILWVLALMSFLCAMTLAGSFFLSNITKDWEQGLRGQLTIEIQAPLKQFGSDIKPDTEKQERLAQEVLKALKSQHPNLKADLIAHSDVIDLLDPWLGFVEDDSSLQKEFPIPTLIALTVIDPQIGFNQGLLNKTLSAISDTIYLDTHEQWLTDIVHLTTKLRNIGFLLAFIIALTTLTAVAGASKSRLTMHFNEIELLHLMGAGDSYIAKQFSRHAGWMTLEGCGVGIFMALSSIFIITLAQTSGIDSLVPTLELFWYQWIMLFSIPFIACGISYLTAGITSRFFLRCLP